MLQSSTRNRWNFNWPDYIFYGTILLLLWPLFKLTYIITHDGPAHLYNACLIRRILSGDSLTSGFLILKKFPEPNWSGHFLLSVFTTVFSAAVSEKIFLALYIFLFPFFFRRLLLKVHADKKVFVLLVLPFIYSYFFFGGLYNFLAGVTILLAALGMLLPRMAEERKGRYSWILVFSLLLYFSHLLAFGVFILIISLAHLFDFAVKNKNRKAKDFFVTSLPLMLAFLPALFLTSIYFIKKFQFSSGHSDVTISQMLNFLLNITSIVALKGNPEGIYSIVLLALFTVLLVNGWRKKSIRSKDSAVPVQVFYSIPGFWALTAGLMLLFYFVIPDQAATGGVIKFRFQLLFFLFLIILISFQDSGKFVNGLILLTIPCWMILKFNYFFPLMKSLNNEAEQAIKITSQMSENSILLPLNYSTNWMHSNIFNYAGTDKNVLVLDNYEAGMPHFPLIWKPERNPVALLGNFNGEVPLCANIDNFEKTSGHVINYIVTWNYIPAADSCSAEINNKLHSAYDLIFNDNDNLKLYKRK